MDSLGPRVQVAPALLNIASCFLEFLCHQSLTGSGEHLCTLRTLQRGKRTIREGWPINPIIHGASCYCFCFCSRETAFCTCRNFYHLYMSRINSQGM